MTMPDFEKSKTIHASCVASGVAAVLILGPSGSGKSALALELMSRGAKLIADDRTIVEITDYGVRASCPPAIRGQIEARGVGVLAADCLPFAYINLVVDLGASEADRLPPTRSFTLLGENIPLLHKPVHDHFSAAILQYLKAGRST
jgi:HPr kinase/phosphorylase